MCVTGTCILKVGTEGFRVPLALPVRIKEQSTTSSSTDAAAQCRALHRAAVVDEEAWGRRGAQPFFARRAQQVCTIQAQVRGLVCAPEPRRYLGSAKLTSFPPVSGSASPPEQVQWTAPASTDTTRGTMDVAVRGRRGLL